MCKAVPTADAPKQVNKLQCCYGETAKQQQQWQFNDTKTKRVDIWPINKTTHVLRHMMSSGQKKGIGIGAEGETWLLWGNDNVCLRKCLRYFHVKWWRNMFKNISRPCNWLTDWLCASKYSYKWQLLPHNMNVIMRDSHSNRRHSGRARLSACLLERYDLVFGVKVNWMTFLEIYFELQACNMYAQFFCVVGTKRCIPTSPGVCVCHKSSRITFRWSSLCCASVLTT